MKHRLTAALLAAVLSLSLSVPAMAYSDTASHWAGPVIEKASRYGLMVGYPDGRFGVGDYLNRASFVTILCQMLDWEPVKDSSPSFIDCSSSHWAYGYVEAARAHGVTDAGGPFRPDDPISREEMAVMLVRALGYQTLAESLSASQLPFSDVTRNAGYIALAYQISMVSGIREGDKLLFKPALSATRAEAATMLVQVYERYAASTDWLHGFYAVSSYSQINLTRDMDAVSLGWARMEYDDASGPRLNTTKENGNSWAVPQDPTAATGYFQRNGTPYNLCVFASGADASDPLASTVGKITANAESRARAIAALTAAAEDYSGLTMDFEGLKSSLKANYTAFIRELRAALPADKSLYVCVQPGPWYTGYDFRALGESCDKVILMAHDYRWSSIPASYVGTARTDCPVTPFARIYDALTEITDPDTGVADRSRIALALSMDTTGFRIDENGLLLDDQFYRPSIETLSRRLAQSDTVVTYSQEYRNPYAVYTDEAGSRYKVWFENGQSVADKIQLAKMFGVTGVSIWRLGNIPAWDSYDLWSAVQATR